LREFPGIRYKLICSAIFLSQKFWNDKVMQMQANHSQIVGREGVCCSHL
jgi:hypothetical protein